MTAPHGHWVSMDCRQPGCPGSDSALISFGVLSGFSGIASQLMLHLGVDPDQHRDVRLELEMALGEGTLEIGEQLLREHGLVPATDPERAR